MILELGPMKQYPNLCIYYILFFNNSQTNIVTKVLKTVSISPVYYLVFLRFNDWSINKNWSKTFRLKPEVFLAQSLMIVLLEIFNFKSHLNKP